MAKFISIAAYAALSMAVLFGLLLLCAFADGYVLARLWEWFAVPHGMPVVSWQALAAVSGAYGLITLKIRPNNPRDERSNKEKLVYLAGYLSAPWVLLLVMWVLK